MHKSRSVSSSEIQQHPHKSLLARDYIAPGPGADATKETISLLRSGKSKVTLEQVLAAVEQDDNIGICVECGEETCGGVEPDARYYTCEGCGKPAVFGAEELLMLMA